VFAGLVPELLGNVGAKVLLGCMLAEAAGAVVDGAANVLCEGPYCGAAVAGTAP
jgi:hypothetical protein